LGWLAAGLVALGAAGWLALARRCRTRRVYAAVTFAADAAMTAGLAFAVTVCALDRLWVAAAVFAAVTAWYLRAARRWRRRRRRLAVFAMKMEAVAHVAAMRPPPGPG
jgi:hypothetical protein